MFTQTRQPPCWIHHVHFLGYTWVDDPLDITARTPHLHNFGNIFLFQCSPCLSLIEVPTQTLTWKRLRTKGVPRVKVRCFMHYGTVLFQNVSSRAFLYSSSSFSVSSSCLLLHFFCVLFLKIFFASFFKCLLKTFMYSLWSGQVKGSCQRSAL